MSSQFSKFLRHEITANPIIDEIKNSVYKGYKTTEPIYKIPMDTEDLIRQFDQRLPKDENTLSNSEILAEGVDSFDSIDFDELYHIRRSKRDTCYVVS